MKHLMVAFILSVTAWAQLPDAPLPMPAPPPVFRTKPDISRLEKWDHRTFWWAFGANVASQVFDAEMTHQGLAHHKCVEGQMDWNQYPSRGQLYRKFGIEQAGVFAIAYVLHRGHIKFIPQGMFTASTVIHVRGGMSWATGCW